MGQRYPAPEQAEGQATGFERLRRYETARPGFRGVLRALPLAALTALLVALLLAAALGQALARRPAERAAGASQDGARSADTFDWEQWDRTRLAPYQSADTFDWEQHEQTQTSPVRDDGQQGRQGALAAAEQGRAYHEEQRLLGGAALPEVSGAEGGGAYHDGATSSGVDYREDHRLDPSATERLPAAWPEVPCGSDASCH